MSFGDRSNSSSCGCEASTCECESLWALSGKDDVRTAYVLRLHKLAYNHDLRVPCYPDVPCGSCCTCDPVHTGQSWSILEETVDLMACENCGVMHFHDPKSFDDWSESLPTCYCASGTSRWESFTCNNQSVSCPRCLKLASMEDSSKVLALHGYHEMASVYADLLDEHSAGICTKCCVYPGVDGGQGDYLCDLCHNNWISGLMCDDYFLQSQILKFTVTASDLSGGTRRAMFEADKKSRCKEHSKYPVPSCKTCEAWWHEQTTMAGLCLSLSGTEEALCTE